MAMPALLTRKWSPPSRSGCRSTKRSTACAVAHVAAGGVAPATPIDVSGGLGEQRLLGHVAPRQVHDSRTPRGSRAGRTRGDGAAQPGGAAGDHARPCPGSLRRSAAAGAAPWLRRRTLRRLGVPCGLVARTPKDGEGMEGKVRQVGRVRQRNRAPGTVYCSQLTRLLPRTAPGSHRSPWLASRLAGAVAWGVWRSTAARPSAPRG